MLWPDTCVYWLIYLMDGQVIETRCRRDGSRHRLHKGQYNGERMSWTDGMGVRRVRKTTTADA